jgi:hypothetical protein
MLCSTSGNTFVAVGVDFGDFDDVVLIDIDVLTLVSKSLFTDLPVSSSVGISDAINA